MLAPVMAAPWSLVTTAVRDGAVLASAPSSTCRNFVLRGAPAASTRRRYAPVQADLSADIGSSVAFQKSPVTSSCGPVTEMDAACPCGSSVLTCRRCPPGVVPVATLPLSAGRAPLLGRLSQKRLKRPSALVLARSSTTRVSGFSHSSERLAWVTSRATTLPLLKL